jgi:hypothetical protein
MVEKKRNVPVSDLDLQMQMIEPAYGKGGIGEGLHEKLKRYIMVGENDQGQPVVDEQSAWDILGYYTRDIRLGNLDKFTGEYAFVKYYLDLAGDLLQAGLINSFLIALSRAASVIEISQSKGGFLRRRINTLTSENKYSGLETGKRNIFTGKNNNKNGGL